MYPVMILRLGAWASYFRSWQNSLIFYQRVPLFLFCLRFTLSTRVSSRFPLLFSFLFRLNFCWTYDVQCFKLVAVMFFCPLVCTSTGHNLFRVPFQLVFSFFVNLFLALCFLFFPSHLGRPLALRPPLRGWKLPLVLPGNRLFDLALATERTTYHSPFYLLRWAFLFVSSPYCEPPFVLVSFSRKSVLATPRLFVLGVSSLSSRASGSRRPLG